MIILRCNIVYLFLYLLKFYENAQKEDTHLLTRFIKYYISLTKI